MGKETFQFDWFNLKRPQTKKKQMERTNRLFKEVKCTIIFKNRGCIDLNIWKDTIGEIPQEYLDS